MKWQTNIYNPKLPNAKNYCSTFMGESKEHALKMMFKYLEGKTIGRPRESEKYTVEELEEMGLVGVYGDDEDEEYED